ncbi:hypothetical protein Bca4012_064788 [Brassica carinata]
MLKKRRLDENGIGIMNGDINRRLRHHSEEAIHPRPCGGDDDGRSPVAFLQAIVILDKVTAKSKGYGFVTFKHVDGALLALKDPSKKIDGRVMVARGLGESSVHEEDLCGECACRIDGKKGKPLGQDGGSGPGRGSMVHPSPGPYVGYSGGPPRPHHMNSTPSFMGVANAGEGEYRGAYAGQNNGYSGPYRMPPPSSMSGGDFPHRSVTRRRCFCVLTVDRVIADSFSNLWIDECIAALTSISLHLN